MSNLHQMLDFMFCLVKIFQKEDQSNIFMENFECKM